MLLNGHQESSHPGLVNFNTNEILLRMSLRGLPGGVTIAKADFGNNRGFPAKHCFEVDLSGVCLNFDPELWPQGIERSLLTGGQPATTDNKTPDGSLPLFKLPCGIGAGHLTDGAVDGR